MQKHILKSGNVECQTKPTECKMDNKYEHGLQALKNLLPDEARSFFNVYESRLMDNLHREQLHGGNETTRSERMAIIAGLNQLADDYGVTRFNDLCYHGGAIANPQQTKQSQVTSPSPRIWHVPHRRNPFFTGREELLKQLCDRLTTNKTAALTQPQAISGLGGIGKTQTALEYAYLHQQDYRAVLWVNATDPTTLLAEFAKLAQVVGLPLPEAQDPQQTVDQVKSWLAQNQDWLLILDNADNLESSGAYFPESNTTNGHIILTTRAQDVGSLAAPLQVEEMAQTEGALLLLRHAGMLSPEATLDQATTKVQTDAEAIVQELGGLPLAVDQAGAYIEETWCGLAGYLELYEKRRNDLLAQRGRFPPGHSEPVATTWDLSFRLVEQANPAAADLLRLRAFLSPDAIPESLIIKGATELGPALSSLAEDAHALNQAIAKVREFSLLRRKAETHTLRAYPKTCDTTKAKTSEREQSMPRTQPWKVSDQLWQ